LVRVTFSLAALLVLPNPGEARRADPVAFPLSDPRPV
jgi:hypothetical protein